MEQHIEEEVIGINLTTVPLKAASHILRGELFEQDVLSVNDCQMLHTSFLPSFPINVCDVVRSRNLFLDPSNAIRVVN
jgi:hypothetical protein